MLAHYKVPGGKLVVADVNLHDGCLADVQISGDFFLEPDYALDTINHALSGLPADSSVATMAAIIIEQLPAGTRMFGVSPNDIAVVVQRALATKGTP